jgi:hypothetical protein
MERVLSARAGAYWGSELDCDSQYCFLQQRQHLGYELGPAAAAPAATTQQR